jgi:branched-chain amino acid aminotransferase
MSDTLFSINGNIVPESKAVVPVTDRGFLYGDGVFETLHAYGRKLFRVDEHLKRLHDGAKFLHFNPLPDRRRIARHLNEALTHAKFPEANVRVTVTRGTGPRGPSISGTYTQNVIITATRYDRPAAASIHAGAKAIVASFRRQESAATSRMKTLNYLEQILAKREADEAGADEALLLNNAGLLCEGSASNITLISEGTLRVPDSERSGALPGIAQITAMEAARNLKIPVVITALSPWDPARADEAFLSGSMRELTPLVRVDNTIIGNGKAGAMTLELLREYRRIVERDCKPFRYPDQI